MGTDRLFRFHRSRVQSRHAPVLRTRAPVGERGADRGAGDAVAMSAERFIARSRVMRALADQIRRFARADSNVLVAGETGTGKNAVAHELHTRGPRTRR